MTLPRRLVITNDLTQLAPMSRWVRDTARQLGAPPKVIARYDLCANEAVTNLVSYGFADEKTHEIELQFWRNNDALVLEIADDGVAFNPFEYPKPVFPTSLEAAKIGGFGIHLIRNFMDECSYERSNRRNVIRLTCYIGGGAREN